MTSETSTAVMAYLKTSIADYTELSADQITAESQLTEIGLQSVDAVLVCGNVEEKFEIEIDPSEIFEHETVGSFAGAVADIVDAKG